MLLWFHLMIMLHACLSSLLPRCVVHVITDRGGAGGRGGFRGGFRGRRGRNFRRYWTLSSKPEDQWHCTSSVQCHQQELYTLWWSAAPRDWQPCLAIRLTKLSSCPWGQHGVCSAFTFVLYQSGLLVTVLVLWQSVSSALESFSVCIVEVNVKDVTILCRLLLTGVA